MVVCSGLNKIRFYLELVFFSCDNDVYDDALFNKRISFKIKSTSKREEILLKGDNQG